MGNSHGLNGWDGLKRIFSGMRRRRESHAGARRTRGRIRFNRKVKDGKRRLRTRWKKCGRDTTGKDSLPARSAGPLPLIKGDRFFFLHAEDAAALTGLQPCLNCVGGFTGRCPVLCSARPTALEQCEDFLRARRERGGDSLPAALCEAKLAGPLPLFKGDSYKVVLIRGRRWRKFN